MVLPFIPALAGHALRFGITSASLKSGAGTFAQALPFGAGYSFGTYLGFPKNYQQKRSNTKQVYNLSMPYGRRYYSRYSRYPRYPRRYRKSYRSYRRYY